MNSHQINRRQSLKMLSTAAVAVTIPFSNSAAGFQESEPATPPTHLDTFALLAAGKTIPVIFDSDMGTDIDDTWALLYLLKCPELDLKLVACDNHLGKYRTQLTAKFLTACNRSDVPIALSHGGQGGRSHQQD